MSRKGCKNKNPYPAGVHALSRNPHWNLIGLGSNGDGRAMVRLYSGWMYRAHAVWIAAHGPIPEPGLGRHRHQYRIHHINGDPLDDRLENLALMTGLEHIKLHHGNGWGVPFQPGHIPHNRRERGGK